MLSCSHRSRVINVPRPCPTLHQDLVESRFYLDSCDSTGVEGWLPQVLFPVSSCHFFPVDSFPLYCHDLNRSDYLWTFGLKSRPSPPTRLWSGLVVCRNGWVRVGGDLRKRISYSVPCFTHRFLVWVVNRISLLIGVSSSVFQIQGRRFK